MFERFTEKARRVIVLSQEEARLLSHVHIGTEHVLLGLLAESEGVAAGALRALDVSLEAARGKVREFSPEGVDAPSGHIPFTPRAKKVLESSLREALQLGHDYIGTEHLLLGLLRETDSIAGKVLVALGTTPDEVRAQVLRLLSSFSPPGDADEDLVGAGARRGAAGGRLSRGKSALDQFGRNLTGAAAGGLLDPIVGRREQIERVVQVLSRRSKNNPVLIGEPGVGKTAVVEGLAQLIASGQVPDSLRDKQVYVLDLASMVAGSRYRGDFEERFKKVISEITSRGDVIVFLDEMHTLVGAGGAEGAIDASSQLKPLLARGVLQVIGATTLDEYRKHVEKDAALERRFSKVLVPAPSLDETVEMLRALRPRYEEHHRVVFTDSALDAAARLSDRYVADRQLPDKAIDLLDESAARLRIARLRLPSPVRQVDEELAGVLVERRAAVERGEPARVRELTGRLEQLSARRTAVAAEFPDVDTPVSWTVDAHEVAEMVAQVTGVPVANVSSDDAERLRLLESELHERVVGQDQAVSALARAVRRARSGLKDPNRPSGSFIFAGPSGVGKTELAKALAEFLFGDEDALITLDMSEYSEAHTVSRLFGAPPGFVGFDEGGQLTERVRRRPFSVVLFDEVEKAHPDVFNSLLQVLDEGRLSDASGRVVDFKNTVIIMTTNLGSRDVARAQSTGFAAVSEGVDPFASMRQKVLQELRVFFRPEFLNRVDETVVFSPLSREEITRIVDLFVARLNERLVERPLTLVFTQAAKERLAEVGYDQALGARPLRRTIQSLVEDPLADRLLAGEFADGVSHVEVGFVDGEFSFEALPSLPQLDEVSEPSVVDAV